MVLMTVLTQRISTIFIDKVPTCNVFRKMCQMFRQVTNYINYISVGNEKAQLIVALRRCLYTPYTLLMNICMYVCICR